MKKTKATFIVALISFLLLSMSTIIPVSAYKTVVDNRYDKITQQFEDFVESENYQKISNIVLKENSEYYNKIKTKIEQVIEEKGILPDDLTGICPIMVQICATMSAYLMLIFGQPLGTIISYPIAIIISLPAMILWSFIYGAFISLYPLILITEAVDDFFSDINPDDWFALFGILGILLVALIIGPITLAVSGVAFVVAFPICSVLAFVEVFFCFLVEFEALRWKTYGYLLEDW